MRIVILGSSHGAPEPNRRCSSTLIEVGENRYFIDMGMNALEEIINRNIPAESVKAVFVTHMHSDHTDGLLPFFELYSRKYLNADPVFCLPGDLEKTKGAIESWLECTHGKLRPFEFRQVECGLVFDDGVLRVTAYKTNHIDFSYAFLVEAEGKRILFSGDLSHKPTEDFPISVLDSQLDLAICECAHFKGTEYLSIFTDDKMPKKICFNHYSSRFLPTLLEAKESLSRNTEVTLATDGLEMSV